MEPRIQYAKTEDGVNIAYASMGAGIPFVKLQGWPFCHLEAEWWIPTSRQFDERVARQLELIRFDPRGSGLVIADAWRPYPPPGAELVPNVAPEPAAKTRLHSNMSHCFRALP